MELANFLNWYLQVEKHDKLRGDMFARMLRVRNPNLAQCTTFDSLTR